MLIPRKTGAASASWSLRSAGWRSIEADGRWRFGAVLLSVLISICLLASCADDDPMIPSVSPVIHVSATSGVDSSGYGSSGMPYRTLTFALQEVEKDNVVSIAGGLYDTTHGEVFPLQVPSSVTLEASEGDVIIAGSVILQAYAVLKAVKAGFTITSTAGVGVYASSLSAYIYNITVTGCKTGVLVDKSTRLDIYNCLISDNTDYGISYRDTSVGDVRRCEITNNGIGVVIWSQAAPNLGESQEPGGNQLTGNLQADLCNQGHSIIQAQGNTWDLNEYVFTVDSGCSNGTEIGNTFDGTVIFQSTPGSGPLFTGKRLIELESPSAGEIVTTSQPGFSWSTGQSALTFVGLFDQPPVVRRNEVTNTGNMIWAWHSGLANVGAGAVNYEQGIRVVAGRLTARTPEPLISGRTYYWSVWGWNASGLTIVASSQVGYFIVQN
jgi:parallel beta-helix repeat protein